MATGSRDPYYDTKAMRLNMWTQRKIRYARDLYDETLEKGKEVRESLEELGEKLE